jgi:hypothetical protein
LPTEEENCQLVEVTESEVKNSVHSMPKLDTLILGSILQNSISAGGFSDKFSSSNFLTNFNPTK